jgi:hypothetical protein
VPAGRRQRRGTFDGASADDNRANFTLIEGDALPPLRKAGRYGKIGWTLWPSRAARDGACISDAGRWFPTHFVFFMSGSSSRVMTRSCV